MRQADDQNSKLYYLNEQSRQQVLPGTSRSPPRLCRAEITCRNILLCYLSLARSSGTPMGCPGTPQRPAFPTEERPRKQRCHIIFGHRENPLWTEYRSKHVPSNAWRSVTIVTSVTIFWEIERLDMPPWQSLLNVWLNAEGRISTGEGSRGEHVWS